MSSVIYIPKRNIEVVYTPEYGLLYNRFAATDARKITSSDTWRVPTYADVVALYTYCGNQFGQFAGKLKKTGTTYWDSPNTGAADFANFNAKGGGNRSTATNFVQLKIRSFYWLSDMNSGQYVSMHLEYNSANAGISYSGSSQTQGNSIRFLRDASAGEQLLPDGSYMENYQGNNGIFYATIKIGTQVWVCENIVETSFRNNDIIPWHGANPASYFTNAEWNALTTAGVCAYNNNFGNVGPGFSFPT